MNKRTLIASVVFVLVVAAVWAELSYFRFHTYFQRTEVQETLPPVPSTQTGETTRTIVSGNFVKVDAIHSGSGTARIVEQNDVRYLRLEDFKVTNGPDLFVYLAESETPGGSLESLGKYINLGPLKGNAGNQTYEMPEPYQGYDTVVIWCQQFGVLFSYAVMR